MTELRDDILKILGLDSVELPDDISAMILDPADDPVKSFEEQDMLGFIALTKSMSDDAKSDFMIAGAAIEQVVTHYDASLSGAWRFVTPMSYFNMDEGSWNVFLSRVVLVYLRLNRPKTISAIKPLIPLGAKPLLKLQFGLVQLTQQPNKHTKVS